jgi:2-polyprenyl-6-methoxyphenol hydroxylase-like FAD-dependent oxidoreductase
MAAQLIRYQIDFVILEKNEKTTVFSKAIAVQARTLEIFDEIDLARKALEEGRLTTALNIFYEGKRKVAVDFNGLGEGLSPFPFALSLEQCKTEKLLADHLIKNGKTIHWKCEFLRFEQKDGVKVYFKDPQGNEQTIEADYLIGCDGAGSLIRHQMGVPFAGSTVPKLFYVADVKLSSPVINKDQLFIFLLKKGFALFFPMEGQGQYRVVGVLPEKTELDHDYRFEDLEEPLRAQMKTELVFEEVRWFSTYKVHSRMARVFGKDRCFIAGDAAHIHTPAGGQGMNTGIQDAYNLAWKIAYTMRYNMNASVLETYNAERMENAKHLLHTTDRMFDIMAGSGVFWNFVRLKFFPLMARLILKSSRVRKLIFPLISQTGIAYPDSPLTHQSAVGKAHAGDRMPYFVFSDGKSIFDYLKEPVFKVLFFGPMEAKPFDQLKHFQFPVVTSSFSEIPEPIFGDAQDFYVLLRPDNHILYIGKSLNTCSAVFESIA